MSRSTVVRLPRRDEPHDPAYTVRLTDSVIARDLLCLEYLVFPVPAVLAGEHDLHEGAAAGLAGVRTGNRRVRAVRPHRVAAPGAV